MGFWCSDIWCEIAWSEQNATKCEKMCVSVHPLNVCLGWMAKTCSNSKGWDLFSLSPKHPTTSLRHVRIRERMFWCKERSKQFWERTVRHIFKETDCIENFCLRKATFDYLCFSTIFFCWHLALFCFTWFRFIMNPCAGITWEMYTHCCHKKHWPSLNIFSTKFQRF